jgi:salicylate hydroxylase
VVIQPRARYLDGPVAIIGGGIGGLTAALSLQRSGVPVRVFEQARALREIGAGVTITPNAMNVLDFLGIGPALAEQAGETPRYFVRSAADGRELERGPDPDSFVPEFGASYCNLHRGDLHLALTDAVTKSDPDAIALDHRFDDLKQDGDTVIAHFSNGCRGRGRGRASCGPGWRSGLPDLTRHQTPSGATATM